ncbi:MAG: RDD family protein [Rhodocyclaceae bacterium]|nr:RDD family protein [Rhodocyclaceae bacterium]
MPHALPATGLPPSIRRRLASMLYESFLLLGVLSVALVVPHLLIGMIWKVTAPGTLLWLHLFIVLLVYFGWLWKRSGQTLAMQTWKIKLVNASGKSLTQRQVLLRYLLAWPSLLACGIGIVWALIDRDRQFLHDRLAGTRLVRTD